MARRSHSNAPDKPPQGSQPVKPGPSRPTFLRRAPGLRPDETQTRDRWIWQHPDWPAFTWQWEDLIEPLGAARQALGRLQMAARVLSPEANREVLAEALALEGVSTSAIEGESIHPASMAASVAHQLGLPVDPTFPLDRKAEGLTAVLWDALQHPEAPLTVERLCRWHRALFPESRPDITVGLLRQGPVNVETRISDHEAIVHFMAVPRERLDEELERFLAWFNEASSKEDLVRAGVAHLWFVTLHPFDDGNGRMTRALTDLALAQAHGIDPIVRMSHRILAVRPGYYRALETTQAFQHGLDITPWLRWFLEQVTAACGRPEQIIRRTLAKGAFWATHKNVPLNERQRKVLNRLLDVGPEGFEGGMTTRKAVALTGCSAITASRDLTELATWGCLRVQGAGRSTAYAIPWEDLLA